MFRVPASIFINRASIVDASKSLQTDGLSRAFVVSDRGLYSMGHVKNVVEVLRSCEIDSEVFVDVPAIPDMETISRAVARMTLYEPDVIVALGGAAPIVAAKVMRLLYEHPDVSLEQLVSGFFDMQKRSVKFPEVGGKIKKLVCIPTTFGTGAEMTPFAAVYDKEKKLNYCLTDYSLVPDVAVIDADIALTMPRDLAGRRGFSALVNAVESHVSMMATDCTRGLSERAINLLFNNLEASVAGDAKARVKCHNAAAIANMAVGNSFVGVCNSMAHQLTTEFQIPHGVACSILICQIIKFNAEENPAKPGNFSQENYCEIADSMCLTSVKDSPKEKVDKLVERIQKLKLAVGMPFSIKELKVDEAAFMARLDDMSESAFNDERTKSNPRCPKVGEIRQMLLEAYRGKNLNSISLILNGGHKQS